MKKNKESSQQHLWSCDIIRSWDSSSCLGQGQNSHLFCVPLTMLRLRLAGCWCILWWMKPAWVQAWSLTKSELRLPHVSMYIFIWQLVWNVSQFYQGHLSRGWLPHYFSNENQHQNWKRGKAESYFQTASLPYCFIAIF